MGRWTNREKLSRSLRPGVACGLLSTIEASQHRAGSVCLCSGARAAGYSASSDSHTKLDFLEFSNKVAQYIHYSLLLLKQKKIVKHGKVFKLCDDIWRGRIEGKVDENAKLVPQDNQGALFQIYYRSLDAL